MNQDKPKIIGLLRWRLSEMRQRQAKPMKNSRVKRAKMSADGYNRPGKAVA